MGNYTGTLDTVCWDPQEYEVLAQDLTNLGQKYEEYVNAGAEAINTLGKNGAWKGYLYNQLVATFNEKITILNYDADLLTTILPTKISNQTQDQALANHGSLGGISLAELSGIINLQETEDNGKGSVYIDPVQVDAGISNFVDDMSAANKIVEEYLNTFLSTVEKGMNVSLDVEAMENQIRTVVDDVFEFNEKFKDSLTQCATESAQVMSAALERSEEEANL